MNIITTIFSPSPADDHPDLPYVGQMVWYRHTSIAEPDARKCYPMPAVVPECRSPASGGRVVNIKVMEWDEEPRRVFYIESGCELPSKQSYCQAIPNRRTP